MADRSFRASQTYIWRSLDNLGNGAFGTVYKGYHKKSGKAVAIKTFNAKHFASPHTIQQHLRELEILKSLNHPNIIKLMAVESEVRPGHPSAADGQCADVSSQVLIMELATEGSLYTLIEQPENNCGFCDVELLTIMSHLSEGLQYLRQKNVLHRDVKPSNILKTVTEEGAILYKLCDFGAARILAENEPFQSLVGTEEYLHPAIYDRALLGGGPSQFSATCDLWSIGVTLYQISTGQLPFRPFGGARGNKNTMHLLTAQKPSGCLSGTQEAKNGPINWSRELPLYCQMSSGLRPVISRLLAMLMELEKTKQWTFEKFFQEVSLICSCVPVHVFFVTTAGFHTVYVQPNFTMSSLISSVSTQLKIPVENILLLWGGKTVKRDVDCDNFLRDLKSRNSRLNPLAVWQREGRTCSLTVSQIPIKVSFTDQFDLDADVELGRSCCTLSHWIKREILWMNDARKVLHASLADLSRVLRERVSNVDFHLSKWKKCWDYVLCQLKPVKACSNLSAVSRDNVLRKTESAKQISTAISQIESEILTVKSSLISLKSDISPSPPFWSFQVYSSNDLNLVSRICDSLSEIHMQFKKDRSLRIEGSSSLNEVNWHNLKKKQLYNQWQAISKLIAGSDFMVLKQEHEAVLQEVEKLIKISEKLSRVEAGIEGEEGLSEMVEAFYETVEQVIREHIEQDHEQGNGEVSEKFHSQGNPSVDPVNFYHSKFSSDFANSALQIVQTSQDLRSLTQASCELFQECYCSMVSGQEN